MPQINHKEINSKMEVKNNESLKDSELNKLHKNIDRKKFFMFSGSAILGFLALSKMPFNIFKSKSSAEKTETSIKITQNPNAVKRKSRQANTGQVNNG